MAGVGLSRVSIALPRGINVGGKNRLPMKDLVAMFVEIGCDEVRARLANRARLTTDGLVACVEGAEGPYGGDVNYAQVLKTFDRGKLTAEVKRDSREPRPDADEHLVH